MREYCTSGSVRGAARKGSPYRGGVICHLPSVTLLNASQTSAPRVYTRIAVVYCFGMKSAFLLL